MTKFDEQVSKNLSERIVDDSKVIRPLAELITNSRFDQYSTPFDKGRLVGYLEALGLTYGSDIDNGYVSIYEEKGLVRLCRINSETGEVIYD